MNLFRNAQFLLLLFTGYTTLLAIKVAQRGIPWLTFLIALVYGSMNTKDLLGVIVLAVGFFIFRGKGGQSQYTDQIRA